MTCRLKVRMPGTNKWTSCREPAYCKGMCNPHYQRTVKGKIPLSVPVNHKIRVLQIRLDGDTYEKLQKKAKRTEAKAPSDYAAKVLTRHVG